MAKTRGASAALVSSATRRTERQALKEKTNTTRPQVPLYDDDGDMGGLIQDAKPRRGRSKRPVRPELEVLMTGGLGTKENSSEEGSDQTLPISSKTTASELVKIPTMAQPTTRPNRRPRGVRKIVPDKSQQEMFVGMKKRMENTARSTKSRQITDTSGPTNAVDAQEIPTQPVSTAVTALVDPISPSPPRRGRNSIAQGGRSSIMPPSSALKVHGTPAMESSLLALRNFKRRPRQPSMLQMVQQRTASARPSAVHVHADEGESSGSDFDLGDLDDGDDFAPDAEGTPLKIKAPDKISFSEEMPPATEDLFTEIQPSANPRKRKSNKAHSSSALLRSRQDKRQRSSSTVMLSSFISGPQSSVSMGKPTMGSLEMVPSNPNADIEVINSSPPSSPPLDSMSPIQHEDLRGSKVLVASSWQDQDQDQDQPVNNSMDENRGTIDDGDADEVLADPVSSSPSLEPQQDFTRGTELVDPITQLSPAPKRQGTRKTKARAISTAQLQTLLPKRRRRLEPRQRKTAYDLDSDSDAESALDASALDDDEDELGAALQPRDRNSVTSKKVVKAKAKLTGKKSRTTPKKNLVSPQKKIGRTYSKKTRSDKENDEGYETPSDGVGESTVLDTSLTMQEVSKSNELEEAKRKFAEVDDWDMDFESFSAEDHRSSSFGWR